MNNIVITTETAGLREGASDAERHRLSSCFKHFMESGDGNMHLTSHSNGLAHSIQIFSHSLDSASFFTGSDIHSLSTAWRYLQGLGQILSLSIGPVPGLPDAFSGPLNINAKLQMLNLNSFTNKFVVSNLLQFFEESDPNFSPTLRERNATIQSQIFELDMLTRVNSELTHVNTDLPQQVLNGQRTASIAAAQTAVQSEQMQIANGNVLLEVRENTRP